MSTPVGAEHEGVISSALSVLIEARGERRCCVIIGALYDVLEKLTPLTAGPKWRNSQNTTGGDSECRSAVSPTHWLRPNGVQAHENVLRANTAPTSKITMSR